MEDVLDSLVLRAQAEDEEDDALMELGQLSAVPENRAALFAHPGVFPLMIHLCASDARELALRFLRPFADDVMCQRELFLREGLVEAIVTRFETNPDDFSIEEEHILNKMLDKLENKIDFVRCGYAGRFGVLLKKCDSVIQHTAGTVLLRCLWELDSTMDTEGGRESQFDVLREDFFHVPGLVERLVHTDDSDLPPQIFAQLAKCKHLAQGMFEFPHLVRHTIRDLECDSWDERREAAFNALARLVCHYPAGGAHFPELMPELVRGAEDAYDDHAVPKTYGDREARIRAELRAERTIVETKAMIPFFANVPGLWTVMSHRHLKQRSPLRRLPEEMFRLLHETLCGDGGLVYFSSSYY